MAAEINIHYDESRQIVMAYIEYDLKADHFVFAFYLYQNKIRIAKSEYNKNPAIIFTAPQEGGNLSVSGFIKNTLTDQIQRLNSRCVGVKPSSNLNIKELPSRLSFIDQYIKPIDHISIDKLASKLLVGSRFRAEVTVDLCTFPIYAKPSTEKRLFILLSGAASSRNVDKFPNFNRWSWADQFPGTVLCIADPTLAADSNLLLGWYVGTTEINVSTELVKLVRRISEALDIKRKNIIFYGSSGGGFAAMMLAPLLGEGATAIAINPQTRIIKYNKSMVDYFLATCFTGVSSEQTERIYLRRLSAIHAWNSDAALSTRLLLIQNAHDSHHYRSHFRPMLDALCIPENDTTDDGRIRTLTFEDQRGHSGVDSLKTLPEILAMAMALKY